MARNQQSDAVVVLTENTPAERLEQIARKHAAEARETVRLALIVGRDDSDASEQRRR